MKKADILFVILLTASIFFIFLAIDERPKNIKNDVEDIESFMLNYKRVSSSTPESLGFTPITPTTYATATSSLDSIRIPIMIYHSVRPHYSGESIMQDKYDVTPELLQEEVTYIKLNGYKTITFADVSKYFSDGTPLPQKPVILSFDDGWENQYRYAYSILKKEGVVGTFYIFTNPIDKKPHWMTWAQIIEMDKNGMEIGGHSWTHPILSKIKNQHTLDREILSSKKTIETRLGHNITTFAYPFGAYNDQVESTVINAGYLTARTVKHGAWTDSKHQYRFEGALSSDDIVDFIKELKSQN